jgi:aminoglycoside phosphotransferase
MNAITSFLRQRQAEDGLQGLYLPPDLTALLVTPRFMASAHVVYLFLSPRQPAPLFVAKISRLPGESPSLERERSNLERLHALWPEAGPTIPAPIAFERYQDHTILLESALAGPPLDPPAVRRDPERSARAGVTWLTRLARATQQQPPYGWYHQLVEAPLSSFETLVPPTPQWSRLLERTRELAEPLRHIALPLVFEHGDFSHPNLIRLDRDRIGVLDWEVATPAGLPACDLFFFLAYIAFSRHRSRSRGNYVEAFRSAFLAPQAWSGPYVRSYSQALQLPPAALTPLFVLTWARHTAGLLARLPGVSETTTLPPAVLTWLERNRFYTLWQEAVANAPALNRAAGQVAAAPRPDGAG